MKLLFSVQNHVQTFQVQENVLPQDLTLLKNSISRFFDSNPAFAVLDLSQASLEVSDSELQVILTQIKTQAQAKNIHFGVAQSDIESHFVHQNVLESALLKRAQILENKLELRDQLKKNTLRMMEENERLKQELNDKLTQTKQESRSKLNPLFERLWSDRT